MKDELARELFEHIRHGDDEHQAWLKDELDKFFALRPTSPKADEIRAKIDELRDEADLCRNEGAEDIAVLLSEAATLLESLIPAEPTP